MAPPEGPEGTQPVRSRPWSSPGGFFRWLGEAVLHLGEAAGIEAAPKALEAAGDRILSAAERSTAVAAERVAATARTGRELDTMAKMLMRRDPAFYAARAQDVGRPLVGAARAGLARSATSGAASAARGAASAAGGLLGELGAGLGKKLLGKVPLIGTAYEVLKPSPLSSMTPRTIGAEMLARWRAGGDPWIPMAQGYLVEPNDWRRANTYMMAGLNPLQPGRDAAGMPYRFAGDVAPAERLDPHFHWVFEPEEVGLSSRNPFRDRAAFPSVTESYRREVGSDMLARWRRGEDHRTPDAQTLLRSRDDWRRADAFMTVGLNPLVPGSDTAGRPYRFAGEMAPHQGLDPSFHWVFEPEMVTRSDGSPLRARPYR